MIDWSKPVELVDGTPLRLLCTDAPGLPVVLMMPSGSIVRCNLEGYRGEMAPMVRNAIEKHVGWLNVYSPNCACLHPDKNDAIDRAYQTPRARVRVEWYDGEGIE